MAFDNQYPKRKDRRRQYYDSRRFDMTCRNNRGCPACEGNRTHKHKRREPIVTEQDFELDQSQKASGNGRSNRY